MSVELRKSQRFLMLLLLALGLVGVGLAAWQLRSREPSYQGKPLGSWLEELAWKPDDTKAVAAVQAIGTNALPHLLRSFPHTCGGRREAIYRQANRLLHETLHKLKRPLLDPAHVRYMGAMRGFRTLGPAASNAVPYLSPFLEDSTEAGWGAGIWLAYTGPAAFPVFIQALTNRSAVARNNALRGLAQYEDFGTNAALFAEPLLNCLQDTNVVDGVRLRFLAVHLLGLMRGLAPEVVPALTNLLTDPDYQARLLSLDALRNLGPKAESALPAVTQALSDPHPVARSLATNALEAIAPKGGRR